MADSFPILLALELLDDSEVEISELLDEEDDITLFSVGSSYMRRNLNRVRDYFESTIPLYFPDEFKGHFRMTSSISGLWETGREQEWSNGTVFSGYSDFPEF